MNRKQQFKRENRDARRLLLTKRVTPTEFGQLLTGELWINWGTKSLMSGSNRRGGWGRYYRTLSAAGSIPQRVVLTGWSNRRAARLLE